MAKIFLACVRPRPNAFRPIATIPFLSNIARFFVRCRSLKAQDSAYEIRSMPGEEGIGEVHLAQDNR
jgi:hypothetical protein